MLVVVMALVVLFVWFLALLLTLMFVVFFTAFLTARLMPWFNCDSPVAARCDDTQDDREHNALNMLARVISRM